jgi:4-amino-4-deoxy-L-arabinose transferase-like glycosyltransferase
VIMVSRAARRRGALAFGLAAAAVVTLTWQRAVGISNDGVQYVEGARRLLAGDGYSTSILYFDEHYRTGTLPAPQTVWPPGTSAAIAVVAAFGGEPEAAGRLVARLAYLFLPPLVFLIGVRLTGSVVPAALCAIWQLGMTEFWMYLASPNSDLPFLAASLGAITLFPDRGGSGWRWLAASLLLGVAVLFRYAGVFFLLPLGLVLVIDGIQTWRRTRVFPFRPFTWAAPGFVLVGALLLRNRLIAGDLRGGNTLVFHQPLGGLLVETFRSLVDTLGGAARSDLAGGGVRAAAAATGAVGLVILGLAAGRGAVRLAKAFTFDDPAHRYVGVLGLMVLTYVVAILGTASRTMLTYGQRYLLPVLPLIACLLVTLALRARTGLASDPA